MDDTKMPKAETHTSDKLTATSAEKPGILKAIREYADLNVYPKPLEVDKGHKHITLGDLHGNAMKLIYTLIEEGVLELDQQNYKILNYFYNSDPEDLTREDLDRFKSILDSAKINKDKSITLIGDELADRGNNDWFMLLIIKRLHVAEVDLDILISNHGVDFFEEIEGMQPSLKRDFSRSYQNMVLLMELGLISEEEVEDIVNEHYIPIIKAINYSISDIGDLTIYSHAPIGLETVEALALKLGIDYDDKNQASLMRTIDYINREINKLFITNKLASFFKDEETNAISDAAFKENSPISLKYPLFRLIWNRGLGSELRMKSKNGLFEINDVHGHVGMMPITTEDGIPSSKHQNLDNNFGKSPETRHAKVGTIVEHFTRRSPDNPVDTLKYLLRQTLAEIQALKTDGSIDEFIAAQKLDINNIDDKAELLKIKTKLECMLDAPKKSVEQRPSNIFFADKLIAQISELEKDAYDLLYPLHMLEDLEIDKFVEEQSSSIETAMLKVSPTSDPSCLNEIVIEITCIIEIITEKKASMDVSKPYPG